MKKRVKIIVKITTLLIVILLSHSCATQSNKNTEKELTLCTTLACRNLTWTEKFKHCGTFIHECGNYTEASIKNQYSLQGFAFQYDPDNSASSTYQADREAFLNKHKPDVTHQLILPPAGLTTNEFADLIRTNAKTYQAVAYWPYGPNSNSAADYPIHKSGAKTNMIDGALGLHHYHQDSELDQVKNNAVRLFYEYASSKAKTLLSQIKSQTLNNGNFENLNIGDSKEIIIYNLQTLQANYITTHKGPSGDMIDLRNINNTDHMRLLESDRWNISYDDNGEIYWFLQLDFNQQELIEIKVKSSGLELP